MITLLIKLHACVAKHHCPGFLYGWFRQMFTRPHIMLAVPEYPGISACAAGNHDQVAAGLFHHGDSVLRSEHISVSDYGDMHCLLDPTDNVPIRLAGIVLLARSPMHRDCICAGVLKSLSHLDSIDLLIVKSLADLDGDRSVRGIFKRPDDLLRSGDVPHER